MRRCKFLIILTLVFTILTLTSCDWDAYYEWAKQFDKSQYQVKLDVDFDNKPTLKLLYPNSGMADSQFSNSWTTEYFEKITGYNAEYFQVLGEQTPVVNNILASSTPYHMLKLESGTYLELVKGDSFVDLKPFLDAYGKDLYEQIPQQAWDAVSDEEGHIYAIPEIGFSGMISFALVWNMDQLAEVGITKTPETIGEVNDAFTKLQNHFYNSENDSYHAFAMQSSQAYIPTLAAAWDLEQNFYVNEDEKIRHVMYKSEYLSYTKWLNSLVRSKVISEAWKGYSESDIISEFAVGRLGCGYLSYWSINTLVSKLAAQQRITEEEARAKLGFSLFVKGDGTLGTPVQEEAKYISYYTIGYYCAVPRFMSDYTAYVVDWMNKRITTEAFEGYRLGEETTKEKPEEGHFYYSRRDDPNAIEVTVGGMTKYVVLTPRYETEILPTSMYQTGVNPAVGTNLWVLSEKSYNAWNVLVPILGENTIGNALGMTSYIEGWSPIDIAARSWVITYEQGMLNAKTEDEFDKRYQSMIKGWTNKLRWNETVDSNVQAWYQSYLAKQNSNSGE